eukprot:TRINITY_DN8409_c0_g1_i2.p1 TRINITY_DN8409_c0_g1~~TRINITY_DN8409_c0_g1_i2.p1  ORF type:complete len:107 (-),score=20.04 TRINITY_DN8409_c0_g1_i2:869-1189(-)
MPDTIFCSRATPVPIFVAHYEIEIGCQMALRTLLVPINGNKWSRHTIRYGIDLADTLRSRLILLSILNDEESTNHVDVMHESKEGESRLLESKKVWLRSDFILYAG